MFFMGGKKGKTFYCSDSGMDKLGFLESCDGNSINFLDLGE